MQFARRNRKTFAAGSTLTLSRALHDGAIILLDTLTGSVVTLPQATGAKTKITCVITVVATSNSHIMKVANATDIFIGQALGIGAANTDLSGYVANGTTHDTITLNRTTSGSTSRGEYFEFEDVASGLWWVNGVFASSGVQVTPFSATVS